MGDHDGWFGALFGHSWSYPRRPGKLDPSIDREAVRAERKRQRQARKVARKRR